MLKNLHKKFIYSIFFILVSISVYAGAPPPPDDEIPITDNIGMLMIAGGLYLVKVLIPKATKNENPNF